VVGGVVKHDDCLLPPLYILGVKIVTELEKKQTEGTTIGLAAVHSKQDLPSTAESGNDIHTLQPLVLGDQVPLPSREPSSLPMVSKLDHRFVDIDDPLVTVEQFDKLACSKLSLEFGRGVVLACLYGPHHPV
jgi:hypothetical protein